MLANHDLALHWPHRRVNELDRITDRRLSRVFAGTESLIALADLDIARPEHGGAIAQEESSFTRCALQALGVLHHLPVHSVGKGTHEGGVKVGDEQCRVRAIK